MSLDKRGMASILVKCTIILFLTLFGGKPYAFAYNLGPYQLILDSQLLGHSLSSSVPSTTKSEPVPPKPSWSQDYRLTMITEDENGLRVGLENIRNQTSYLLLENQRDEAVHLELIHGNFTAGTARIRNGASEHIFVIQGGVHLKNEAGFSSSKNSTTPVVIPQSRRVIRRSPSQPVSMPETKISNP